MRSVLGLLIGDRGDFPSMAVAEAATRFRPRADGDFDYFPDGIEKPGYRVDPVIRERIMQLGRGRDGLFVGTIIILVLASFVLRPLLSRALPFGVLIFLTVGGVAEGIVGLIAQRGTRRMIGDLLRNAPAVHGLTERECRALLLRQWAEVPRRRLLRNFLVLLVPAIFTTAAAMQEGAISFVPRVVIIGLAVLMWLGVLQLVYELIRLWRWSRAVR